MNEEWVVIAIQRQVDKAIQNAITGIGDSFKLRSTIEDVITDTLSEKLSK